jgi:hypothetical protein
MSDINENVEALSNAEKTELNGENGNVKVNGNGNV